MLSDAELLDLLRSPRESVRVERKESLQGEEVRKTACAFANDLPNTGLPGVIFIGVRNDGSCANLDITDRILLNAGELRADGNLLPAPVIEVEERSLAGCRVVVIAVHPHSAPPVRFKGRAWIRVGPRNQKASPEGERVLNERRRGRDLPFDYRSISPASMEDVDLFRFCERYLRAAISSDVIAENDRTDRERMISLRLLDPSGLPTAGGLLLVGKDPEAFIPGAYVQYNRFDGTQLTDAIVDTKRLSGTIDDQLSALEEVMKINIRTEVDLLSGDREVRASDYPIASLQQFARNAIMHRNYESNAPTKVYWFTDRVEIHNPGGLFGQVNPSNFGTGVTDYRNPLIAEGMKNYGFVQRFGVGIPVAKRALVENGNPAPEYAFSDSSTAVVVRSR